MRSEILVQLWPQLELHLLPLLYAVTAPDGAFPLDGWPKPLVEGDAAADASLPSLRISDMFVRRYTRPPRGSPDRRDRSLHRWSIPQHKDASELSVSVELSAPDDYDGGLYIGKRLGYSALSGWQTARTLPPLSQGSAVVHRGNLTHGVTLKSGERWSLIVFFFRSCATQSAYFERVETARDHQRRHHLDHMELGVVKATTASLCEIVTAVLRIATEAIYSLRSSTTVLLTTIGCVRLAERHSFCALFFCNAWQTPSVSTNLHLSLPRRASMRIMTRRTCACLLSSNGSGKTAGRLADAVLGSLGVLTMHTVAWVMVYARRPFVVEGEGEASETTSVSRDGDGSGRAKME